MVRLSTFLVSFVSLACATRPSMGRRPVHESLDKVPDGFVHVRPADPEHVLELRLAISPNNVRGLQEKLYNVSTPGNPEYGKHLTKEEAEAFVVPSHESDAAVKSWLSSNNISYHKASPAGDWLGVKMTVQQANAIFYSNFSMFKHMGTGKESVRTLAYSIPESLEGHIDFVHPTTAFPIHVVPKPKVIRPSKFGPSSNISAQAIPPDSCNTDFVPSCAQQLYGIPSTPATQQGNRIAVSGFGGQFASQRDLQIFLQKFRPDIADMTFDVEVVDGGQNDQNNPGGEANLDIQYTVGIASRVPVTFVSVGFDNSDGLSGFMDIVEFLLNKDNVPTVLSTSFEGNEPGIPSSVANRLCNAYAQLGARGTSILFSSGDGGVAGVSSSQSCTNFVPTFPSGCPFVTSVGGTIGVAPETAGFFSTGGFSGVFPRPPYQDAAVSSYFAKVGNPFPGKFDPSGRGFPDISAAAVDFDIAVNGQFGLIAGTSCSTPLMAGVIALLNDQLIAKQRPPLGFLNPFLYMNPQAFTPITSGSNPGCNTQGFSAVDGWSPVTGLGSPIFSALQQAAGL